MDPENELESGYADEPNDSEFDEELEEFEEDADDGAQAEEEDGEEDAARAESPAAEADVDDLPEFADRGLSEEERQSLLERLGSDDPLAAIDALIERRVNARLASNAHANIHLNQAAARNPDFYRTYGPQTQALLSNMDPKQAGTKQGVQMATLGAIAQRVLKTGDLEGEILRAADAIQKARKGGDNPPAARRAEPLPPEARTQTPTVGKRPASSTARKSQSGRTERTADALAEMVGTNPRKARRYLDEM